MSSHNSREEQLGVQTNVEPHCADPQVVQPIRSMSGAWRDISSAPKDGNPFFGWVPGDVPQACCAHYRDGKWLQINPGVVVKPTHWMPLPAPPSSEEQRPSPSEASAGNAGLDDLNPLPPDIKEWIEELRRSAESPDEADDGSWELTDEGRKTRDRDRLRLSALLSLAGERDEARRERAHYSEAYREARDDAIARERRALLAEKERDELRAKLSDLGIKS